MAVFPSLIPSSRTFTPGEYPHTPYQAISGVEGRVRHSNVMLTSTLRLTFISLTEANMLSILSHYNGQQGGFNAFAIPSQLLNGVSAAADYTLTGYQWRYAQSPIIDDIPCAGHSVELTLESVPPEAVVLSGLASTVLITLTPGDAAAANGIQQQVTITLSGGQAGSAGADLILAVSFTGGAATGEAFANGMENTVMATIAGGAATGGVGSSDPDFASVSLLLHMDGSNGSTTFADSSNNVRTVTANGNAQISTTQSKFGGASGSFDGSGDYLTSAYSTSLYDWWPSDYTIEAWVYATSWSGWSYTSTGAISCMVGNMTPGGGTVYWSFGPVSSGALKFYYYNGGEVHTVVTSATLPTSQWNHIAAVKTSSGVTLYINGVSSGGTFAVASTPQSDSGVFLTVGQINGVSITGYIDDLRITKGVARYTSNFTPPTAAFPDS